MTVQSHRGFRSITFGGDRAAFTAAARDETQLSPLRDLHQTETPLVFLRRSTEPRIGMSFSSYGERHTETSRLLVVAGDAEALWQSETLLRTAGFSVTTAPDRDTALRLLDQPFDLVVIGSGDRVADALELCATMRLRSNLPIVMLAPGDAEENVLRAFRAGVDDYLAKGSSGRMLLARIAAVLRRSRERDCNVVAVGDTLLELTARRLFIGFAEFRLTRLETALLAALLASQGRVVSSHTLVARAWGRTGRREQRALKQVIYRLRLKLCREPGYDGRLRSLRSAGYCWRADVDSVEDRLGKNARLQP